MEGARLMLRAARQCLDERQARYVLLMGDQLYADFPEPLSLFDPAYFRTVAPEGRRTIHDCTPQEVRRIYQHRYRHFWNQEDWLALQAERPCYPILDDHDLIDNWGSREAHQEPAWRSVGVGGRLAYLDYQGSRVRDMDRLSPFHYSFEYGPVATFVMDLRSERKAGDNGRLYSEAQQRDLERFLEAHTDKAVLCLVLSVPLVHLPRFLARAVAALPHTGEDFSDRWSSGAHVRDRDRLLRIIHDHQARHPRQRFLLLSGDIHIGCLHAVRWNDGAPTLHQVISSPVTHHTSFPLQWASKSIIQLNRTISTRDRRLSAAVRPVRGVSRRMRNPFGKLNLGIVEFETEANGGGIRSLRVLFYGHRQGVPRLRFDSGNLIARH
jgi:alkaline phosphatase D